MAEFLDQTKFETKQVKLTEYCALEFYGGLVRVVRPEKDRPGMWHNFHVDDHFPLTTVSVQRICSDMVEVKYPEGDEEQKLDITVHGDYLVIFRHKVEENPK